MYLLKMHVKFAIGPSIHDGFYYDFDVEKPFTDEDKAKIEDEMKKIIKEDIKIERFSLSKKEALELMKEQPYKQELINELPEGEEISFYKQGDFTDLCAGPHLMSTGKVKYYHHQVHIGEVMNIIRCYKEFMQYHSLKHQ